MAYSILYRACLHEIMTFDCIGFVRYVIVGIVEERVFCGLLMLYSSYLGVANGDI